MPWFPCDISALCVAEAALVTAWKLFIDVEGTPDHFATSVSEIPGTGVPLGMLHRCFVRPPRNL